MEESLEPSLMWLKRNQREKSFLTHMEDVRSQLTVYCRNGLRDKNSLEDVIQAILATAYEKYDDFRHGTNFHAWMFRIATNTEFNANRRDKRERDRSADVNPEELDIVEELQREYAYDELLRDPDKIFDHVGDELHAALLVLSERERTVFLLKSICDIPCREIAEILEMPFGSAMGYLARARGKLRGSLAEYARSTGFLSNDIREESPNGLP